jgi:hypothetical protein
LPSRRHTHTVPFFCCLSPYEVPELGVRLARDGRVEPQAGQLGAEREFHPPRYRPSYRAPQVMFSLVSRASSLPQPPAISRWPQHRPAPHASQRYVFPLPRGGDLHPLSHAQPLGFTLDPRDPFRVAQPTPGSPQVWIAVEPRAVPPTRRVWCCTSPHFRRHAAHPAEGRGGGPYPPCPAPAPTGRSVTNVLGTPPLRRKFRVPVLAPKGSSRPRGPRAQGNLSKGGPIPPHHL